MVGNMPGSFGGFWRREEDGWDFVIAEVVGELAGIRLGVAPATSGAGSDWRRETIDEDWTERRVLVMSRGYVIITDVIPAIAPASNLNGVVNSVFPGGISI
jgi:hypothetical protein